MASPVTARVAMALGGQALIIAGLLTVAVDQYAHKRVELLGGVNARGYRGRILHARQPNEIRLLYAGGSQAFGWGVAANETTAAYLRYLIENRLAGRSEDRPVTVANAGTHGLDPSGYAARIAHYQYLDPDLVCLHIDLVPAGRPVMPPPSAVAALSGYTPILPTVLEEKARLGSATVGRLLRTADTWLYGLFESAPPATEPAVAVQAAVDAALQLAGRVVVVLPAPVNQAQQQAHARLLAALQPRVAGDTRLRLVDLSTIRALSSPALRLDATNFGAGGHATEAQAILPAALDALQVQATP